MTTLSRQVVHGNLQLSLLLNLIKSTVQATTLVLILGRSERRHSIHPTYIATALLILDEWDKTCLVGGYIKGLNR